MKKRLWLVFYTLGVIAISFSVGLVSDPKQWFYDLSYNPLLNTSLILFQGTILFYIGYNKGK